MKLLPYAWLIFRNLIVILIALLLFSVAETKFEIVILSILLLIFIDALSLRELLGLAIYEQNLLVSKQFLTVLEVLKPQDNFIEANKMLSEGENKLSDAKIKTGINSIFSIILWLVVVGKLVTTVL